MNGLAKQSGIIIVGGALWIAGVYGVGELAGDSVLVLLVALGGWLVLAALTARYTRAFFSKRGKK